MMTIGTIYNHLICFFFAMISFVFLAHDLVVLKQVSRDPRKRKYTIVDSQGCDVTSIISIKNVVQLLMSDFDLS